MKLRMGFVSNSSSASFVIRTDRIPDGVFEKLREYWNTIKDDDNELAYYDVPDVTFSQEAGILHLYFGDSYGEDTYKKMQELGINKKDILVGSC